jgi:hypothetical protein
VCEEQNWIPEALSDFYNLVQEVSFAKRKSILEAFAKHELQVSSLFLFFSSIAHSSLLYSFSLSLSFLSRSQCLGFIKQWIEFIAVLLPTGDCCQ